MTSAVRGLERETVERILMRNRGRHRAERGKRPIDTRAAWALLCILALCSPFVGVANAQDQDERRADDAEFCCDSRKPWVAAAEIIAVQLIPWSYNRFVRDAEFAQVTPSSIWSNIQAGFEWDPNSFTTNQFAHPYHGHLYFSAGRSNGYNYWESGMWAFGGSLVWEMAGETFPGAINDWVSTSVGGMAIGESTFRLASLIRDNSATGAGRTFREIGATVVNPISGFSRLFRGEWGKVGPNPPDRRPARLGTWIDVGGRTVGDGNLGSEEVSSGFLQLGIAYGSPLDGDYEKPFDSFTMDLQLFFGDTATIGALQVNGILWGTHLSSEESASPQVFVLDQRYDYQNNRAFEFGGQSFGAGWMSRFQLSDALRFGAWAQVNGVLLGALNSEYAALAGRDYDFVTGAGLRGGASLGHPRFLALVKYDGAFLHTVNGSPSDHITHILTARGQVNVWRNIGAGVLGNLFIRSSRYDDFPNVTQEKPELRVFATYTVNPLP